MPGGAERFALVSGCALALVLLLSQSALAGRPRGGSGSAAALPALANPESAGPAEADRPDRFERRAAGAIKPDLAMIPSGKWASLGPAPVGPPFLARASAFGVASGRVTGMAVIPYGSHGGRMVAASAGGGIWTSDDEGKEWSPRTDSAEDLAMGSVTVDPRNANLLIAGTGEANQSGDSYPGMGIMVSGDAGNTWTLENPGGVFSGLDVGSVAIDPNNGSDWFAAAVDPSKSGRGGLYVTTDGGKTWAKPTDPSYAPLDGNINSVVINPTKPKITVYIGGGPQVVGESTDGGVTWSALKSGITAPNPSGRPLTALAIANTNPKILYASVGDASEPAALYKTTTGGASWTQLTDVPDYTGIAYAYGSCPEELEAFDECDQGWYDNVVAVDPFDASRVLVGGIAMLETEDGGNSWVNLNGGVFNEFSSNGIHPDQHAIAFSPTDNAWIGDDGGVFEYRINPFEGLRDANGNLDITQFYPGFDVVAGEVLAGSQDNESARVEQGGALRLP